MVNRVSFDNFRGLKHLELPELSRITLLTGRNNAGKSSVLEGIYLLASATQPESFASLKAMRLLPLSLDSTDLWENVFYNFNNSSPIQIQAVINGEDISCSFVRDDTFTPASETLSFAQNFMNGKTYALCYSLTRNNYFETGHFSPGPDGTRKTVSNLTGVFTPYLPSVFAFSSNFHGTDDLFAEWCGQSMLNGKRDSVIASMKTIDSGISDYFVVPQNGKAKIYVKIDNNSIPVRLTGDGTVRLLQFSLCANLNPGSLILIDEIENGFHYSMQKEFWKTMAKAAKTNNCQIIATTHSYECIQNAVDGIGEVGMENEFCLYRVENEDGENRAFRLDGRLVAFSVDRNMEVR